MTTGNRTNKYAGFLARQNHQRDPWRGVGVKCLCGKVFDLDADHALHQVEEILCAALVAAASVAPAQPSSTVDEGRGMRLVIVESPYAGDVEANIAYARECLRDCLLRGEAPIASHLLYTQKGVLDDVNPLERELGIAAGLAWGVLADATVVYGDLGLSGGMRQGIADATGKGRPVEYRSLRTVTGMEGEIE